MSDHKNRGAATFLYPFEADRALVAATFAKRICSDRSTEAEVEFMCKFMDMPVDECWFEDAGYYAVAAASLANERVGSASDDRKAVGA